VRAVVEAEAALLPRARAPAEARRPFEQRGPHARASGKRGRNKARKTAPDHRHINVRHGSLLFRISFVHYIRTWYVRNGRLLAMRLSEGVEWAGHAAAMLAALPEGRALPCVKLAEFLGVPAPYLAKHLQALSRAGLVETTRGPAGGYRLAKPARDISLADVAAAIEGREPAFRCQNIRMRGPVGVTKEACKRPCGIAASFWAAERAWRDALAKVTLVDVMADAATNYNPPQIKRLLAWINDNAR
jgi:Rrf2 family protein